MRVESEGVVREKREREHLERRLRFSVVAAGWVREGERARELHFNS